MGGVKSFCNRPSWLVLACLGGSVGKMYLFKVWNVFVYILNCIWCNWLVLAGMGGSVGQMSTRAVSSFVRLHVKSQPHPNFDRYTVFCSVFIPFLYLYFISSVRSSSVHHGLIEIQRYSRPLFQQHLGNHTVGYCASYFVSFMNKYVSIFFFLHTSCAHLAHLANT